MARLLVNYVTERRGPTFLADVPQIGHVPSEVLIQSPSSATLLSPSYPEFPT